MILHLYVDDLVLEPVLELCNALFQITSCFKLRVLNTQHVDIWQGVRYKRTQVLREPHESIITPLEAMYKDLQKRSAKGSASVLGIEGGVSTTVSVLRVKSSS